MREEDLPKWNDKGTLDKVLRVFQLVMATGVIISLLLRFTDVVKVDDMGYVYMPMLALMNLSMGVQYRKINKKMMFLLIGVAIFMFGCVISVYLHRFR